MSHAAYSDYKTAKRRFTSLFILKQRAFYQKEYETIENSASTDISSMWKHVKPRRVASSVAAINHNGKMYNSPEDLCHMWKHHYVELLNEQPTEAARYDAKHQETVQREFEHIKRSSNMVNDDTDTLCGDFTVNEIAAVCKTFPNNKAAGYDYISYECMKYGGNKMYTSLALLFNKIVSHMYIPRAFKHSVIIPLYKGKHKPKNVVGSYRGVSLSPILNKVLEKVILLRLKPWLATKDFPPPLQQAGRDKTNCVCLSYVVQEAINNMIHKGSMVYGCFLDIKSAYDVINWQGEIVETWNNG